MTDIIDKTKKSNSDSSVMIFKPNIYMINGEKVILDSDLAKCLNMETKILNKFIKRHIDEFYEEDYFQLTDHEYKLLRSQNVTLKEDFGTLEYNSGTLEHNFGTSNDDFGTSKTKGGRVFFLPFVFTYYGVNALIDLLKNKDKINRAKEVLKLLEDKSILSTNQGETLEKYIYDVRGTQVMLDYDLAFLYECQNGTKDVNKAVSRNIERFPEDFYFQLTEEEFNNLRFQIGTAKSKTRTLPHAFTEEGVSMLATVLKTKAAAKMSIDIMRAFVGMRKYISTNLLEQKYINNQVFKNTEDIKLLKESFRLFNKEKETNEIYYAGQIYDAYSKVLDIFSEAKERLIIIDNYADKKVLDIVKNLDVNVVIITRNNSLLKEEHINKYNNQYSNLKVVFNNSFHDRFFIIDNKKIYHCGTSLNKIGTKTFAINIISDDEVIKSLISKVKKIIS